MGYYADLIKQKQEKRNSAESHLKGLIGKKFKRDTDLERAVNSSIYTEISDWSHPRMVVFDKYTDEKYILTTEDNNQYGKDQEFWISKVQKANSKEEKENESPQSATARRKALQKLEDAQKKANWWGDTTMQKLKHDLTYADEETLLDLVEVLDRYLPKFEAKVKSFGNSNEEKGYYAKLAEEKASRKN